MFYSVNHLQWDKNPLSSSLCVISLYHHFCPSALHLCCNASCGFMLFLLSSHLISQENLISHNCRGITSEWPAPSAVSGAQMLNVHLFIASPHLSSLHPSPLWPLQTVLLVCISIITVPVLALRWSQALAQRLPPPLFLAYFYCFSYFPDLGVFITNVLADACPEGNWHRGEGVREAAWLVWRSDCNLTQRAARADPDLIPEFIYGTVWEWSSCKTLTVSFLICEKQAASQSDGEIPESRDQFQAISCCHSNWCFLLDVAFKPEKGVLDEFQ